MARIHAPFTMEDKERIDNALSQSQKAKNVIQRAKRAGLDMTRLEKELEESEIRLRGVRTQFFEG